MTDCSNTIAIKLGSTMLQSPWEYVWPTPLSPCWAARFRMSPPVVLLAQRGILMKIRLAQSEPALTHEASCVHAHWLRLLAPGTAHMRHSVETMSSLERRLLRVGYASAQDARDERASTQEGRALTNVPVVHPPEEGGC